METTRRAFLGYLALPLAAPIVAGIGPLVPALPIEDVSVMKFTNYADALELGLREVYMKELAKRAVERYNMVAMKLLNESISSSADWCLPLD